MDYNYDYSGKYKDYHTFNQADVFKDFMVFNPGIYLSLYIYTHYEVV